MTIDELDFTPRTCNVLRRAGITTVDELLAADPERLKRIRNCGVKTMAEIEQKVKAIKERAESQIDEHVLYGDGTEPKGFTKCTEAIPVDRAITVLMALRNMDSLSCGIDYGAKEGSFSRAIYALNKLKPMKPKGDYHSVPHHRCPVCNSAIRLYEDDPYDAFCKFCGQAIDWSDD